jgi:hypothetical protein
VLACLRKIFLCFALTVRTAMSARDRVTVRCPCPKHAGGRVHQATRRRCKLAYPASFTHWASAPAAASSAAAAAATAASSAEFDLLDDGGFAGGDDDEWRGDEEEEEKQSTIATIGERARPAACAQRQRQPHCVRKVDSSVLCAVFTVCVQRSPTTTRIRLITHM